MELPNTDALLELIRSGQAFSQYGVLVLVVACLLSAFVVMPRAVLCTGAGFFYGVTIIPFIAGALTVGAVAAFWIARYIARDTIERKLQTRPTARAIRTAVDEEGWRIVTLLRIAAPAPFSTVSYIFGVSGVATLPFAAGTLAGIMQSGSRRHAGGLLQASPAGGWRRCAGPHRAADCPPRPSGAAPDADRGVRAARQPSAWRSREESNLRPSV